MKTIVIDDFFKDYDRMLELAYKQKYYKREEHPEEKEDFLNGQDLEQNG